MNQEAAYPTAVMMLACFKCGKSFNTVHVHALVCHHLICYVCGQMDQYQDAGVCVKCNEPKFIEKQFTAYFNSCIGAEYTLDIQYIRQCVDYVFVSCKNKNCPRTNCPFDHSDYTRETIKQVKIISVKVCRHCKVRGPNAATQCVRCKGPLATTQMNDVTTLDFHEQPVFSYYSSKRI